MQVGARSARDSELEAFLAVNAGAALWPGRQGQGGYGGALRCRRIGDWQATMELVLRAFPPARISNIAMDLARRPSATAMFCRQGYGALLAKLGGGLPVKISMPVDAVYWGKNLAIDRRKGNMLARSVIVTVSTNA